MFPLNSEELDSQKIEELEKVLLSKGYPQGTLVYQGIFLPDEFAPLIVYIILTDNKSHLVLSAISDTLASLKAWLSLLSGGSGEVIYDYPRTPGIVEFWLEQALLSSKDVDTIQQEMAKLDPFTIQDLLKSGWYGHGVMELRGRVFKVGVAAHEFGLRPQNPSPEVLRSLAFFDKMLEFAALALSNSVSQACIAQLQKELS